MSIVRFADLGLRGGKTKFFETIAFIPPDAYDTDAQTWFDAVETADGEALEVAVKNAVNDFVVGIKSDGIWDSLDVIYMLSVARTLSGIAIPLKGAVSPTLTNFVSGDYNRITGLKGNYTTNTYIETNYNMNDWDSSDFFIGAYQTEARELASVSGHVNEAMFARIEGATSSNTFYLLINQSTQNSAVTRYFSSTAFIHNAGGTGTLIPYNSTGVLYSTTSSSSAGYTVAAGALNDIITNTVNSSDAVALRFYTRNVTSPTEVFTGRLSYACIGSNIDHDTLDARMDTLYSDIQGAIV